MATALNKILCCHAYLAARRDRIRETRAKVKVDMAYPLVGLMLWFLFFIIVPRQKWRRYYPTLLFTALLATVCDLLGVVYLQWEYIGPNTGGLSLWSDLGIAPPSGGLAVYLQNKYPRWAWLNWSFWIAANALGERAFVEWGLIRYHYWNSLKATLFYVFFFGLVYLQDQWFKQGKNVKLWEMDEE